MRSPARNRGYTIVEVMIFLVITGVLMVSAMLVFRGRQQRTEFSQGVREIEVQIRTIINETASGYYPNQGNIGCNASGGSGPQFSSASNGQGTNTNCIFVGRVLQFTEGSNYSVHTVVAQRQGADGREVSAYGPGPNEARQTLIVAPLGQPNFPNTSVDLKLPWGITATKISTAAGDAGAFGFLLTLGSYGGSSTDLLSGSTNMGSVPVASTTLTSTKPEVNTVVQNIRTNQINSGRIILCLLSGGGDRRAAIVIGGSNSNTSTESFIDNVPGECNA